MCDACQHPANENILASELGHSWISDLSNGKINKLCANCYAMLQSYTVKTFNDVLNVITDKKSVS